MVASKARRSRGRGSKRHVTDDGRKLVWKMPGFQAFAPNAKPVPKKVKGRKRKAVAYEPVTEPETGIHSQAWAAAIVPQDCGFLRLPLELRMRIYEFAIRDFSCGRTAIEPRKKGMKFTCWRWPNSDEDTSRLYLICRQTYVDTVGRGILYSQKLFYFGSPNMMLNYLWVIHPVHLEALTSIELHINYNSSLNLNSLPFEQLAKCRSLKHLYIQFSISYSFCTSRQIPGRWHNYEWIYPDRFWDKITAWETIRALRGLKDFRISVSGRGSVESSKLMREIEEGIRKVVVKDFEKGEVVELEDQLRGMYESMVVRKPDPASARSYLDDSIDADL